MNFNTVLLAFVLYWILLTAGPCSNISSNQDTIMKKLEIIEQGIANQQFNPTEAG